jgi:hypothetical protein
MGMVGNGNGAAMGTAVGTVRRSIRPIGHMSRGCAHNDFELPTANCSNIERLEAEVDGEKSKRTQPCSNVAIAFAAMLALRYIVVQMRALTKHRRRA